MVAMRCWCRMQALVALLGVAACARDSAPPSPATPTPAVEVEVQTSPLGEAALALLPDVRDGMTLLRWRAARPDDRVVRFDVADAGPYAAPWCAVARSAQPAGAGVTLDRHAYFFPPAQVPARLPEPLAEDELLSSCELRVVWLEVAEADVAEQHAAPTAAMLDAALGASVAEPAQPIRGTSRRWTQGRRWSQGGARVSAGLVEAAREGGSDGPLRRATVIVSAAWPGGEPAEEAMSASLDRAAATHPVITARLRDALTLAALSPDLTERIMRELRPLAPMPEDSLRSIDGEAAAALIAELVNRAGPLPPRRRAAALLAADLLLEAVHGAAGWYTYDGADARQRMHALGARFSFAGEPRADWVYTRTWALQALDLDAGGRAGDIAFVVLMELGFDVDGTCRERQGIDASRDVARRGEAFLRQVPGTTVRADVLRMIGDAHADIVAVSAGLGLDGMAEAEQVRGEASTARLLALENYRAALAIDATSPAGRAAARRAWRLAAGLPPVSTRFYCAND